MQRDQSLLKITKGMASRNHAKQRNEIKQLPAEVCELN
jgi:hypothetical protein